MAQQNYSESDIQVKEGLEGVRSSPGMYIGSTDEQGLMHMIWEIVHNSIDEYSAGRCSKISIELSDDCRTVSVGDNGSGIPVGIHPTTGKSTLETVLTVLHAGGKFEGSTGYSRSGGMHGVGVSVVNALSSRLKATVHRDGYQYTQEFRKGAPKEDVRQGAKSRQTGTTITFTPDYSIMQDIPYDPARIATELEELSGLNKGLEITFKHAGEEKVFASDSGIASLIEKYYDGEKIMNTPIVISGNDIERKVQVDIAFNYVASSEQTVIAYTNNVKNLEGGKHVDGFKSALTKVINKLTSLTYKGDELRNGLVAVVSVKMGDRPVFGGQTKGKLQSEHVQPVVDGIVYRHLMENLTANSKLVKFIVKRAEANRKSKESMSLIRDVENDRKAKWAVLRTKLEPATSKSKKERELFIVEGDSAGGTAIQARNPEKQAILPIRGKILNTDRATIDKLLKNAEIRSIVTTIGAGIGKEVDADKCQYERVTILADADPDGAHIRLLLLTFFYNYMRPLVDAGIIHIALPPLYKVYTSETKYIFCNTEEEKAAAIRKLGKNAIVQRFKGLGEMDPPELRETVMDVSTRTLIQIQIDNADKAASVMQDLMGKDASARKELISEAGVLNADN